MKSFLPALITVLLSQGSSAFSPTPTTLRFARTSTSLSSSSDSIMTDMDIMCIANAAELCNIYEECDVEEREAIVNRFEEQTDVLSERLATMQVLLHHLRTGESLDVVEDVVELKKDILSMLMERADAKANADAKKYTSEEILGGSSVRELQDEIMAKIEEDPLSKVGEQNAKDNFYSAMLEDTENGKSYDAWLGF